MFWAPRQLQLCFVLSLCALSLRSLSRLSHLSVDSCCYYVDDLILFDFIDRFIDVVECRKFICSLNLSYGFCFKLIDWRRVPVHVVCDLQSEWTLLLNGVGGSQPYLIVASTFLICTRNHTHTHTHTQYFTLSLPHSTHSFTFIHTHWFHESRSLRPPKSLEEFIHFLYSLLSYSALSLTDLVRWSPATNSW